MTTTVQDIINYVNDGKLDVQPLYIFDFQFVDNGKTLNVQKFKLVRIHDHRNFKTDMVIFTVEDREHKLRQISYPMPSRAVDLVATNQMELDWLIKVEIHRCVNSLTQGINSLNQVINNYKSFLDN